MFRRAAYLAQMLRNESYTSAELGQRQSRLLRSLVRHAGTRVPFYRELYRQHGIDSAVFDNGELPSLPSVDKTQLRAAGDAVRSLDAPEQRVSIRTSGSSGEPFQFQIDPQYDQWRKAQCLRPYFSAGMRLRDKIMHLTVRMTTPKTWFSHLGLLREVRVDASSDPEQIFAAWQQQAPDVLQGNPSTLRLLAHYCLDRARPLTPQPRLVFTDSELLTADTRVLLQQAFGTAAIDVYGTMETDNIAFECSAHTGYHIASDCAVLEIVRDGRPVQPGEEGEIVVSVLPNRSSPFIRYNLHDIGRLSTQPCPCGRPFPLLEVIQGRADDFIVMPDGRRRTALGVLARMVQVVAAVKYYQLRQTHIGRFELLVVPSGQFTAVGREGILNTMAGALGNAQIELRLVDAIPASRAGKRRMFVSQLDAATAM